MVVEDVGDAEVSAGQLIIFFDLDDVSNSVLLEAKILKMRDSWVSAITKAL